MVKKSKVLQINAMEKTSFTYRCSFFFLFSTRSFAFTSHFFICIMISSSQASFVLTFTLTASVKKFKHVLKRIYHSKYVFVKIIFLFTKNNNIKLLKNSPNITVNNSNYCL